jgi:hypothetical protein
MHGFNERPWTVPGRPDVPSGIEDPVLMRVEEDVRWSAGSGVNRRTWDDHERWWTWELNSDLHPHLRENWRRELTLLLLRIRLPPTTRRTSDEATAACDTPWRPRSPRPGWQLSPRRSAAGLFRRREQAPVRRAPRDQHNALLGRSWRRRRRLQDRVPNDWNGDLVLYAHGFRGTGLELTVSDPRLRHYLVESLSHVCAYITSDIGYGGRVFARRMCSRGSEDAAQLPGGPRVTSSLGPRRSRLVTQWSLGERPEEELKG